MKLTVSFARIKKKQGSPDSGLNVPRTSIFYFLFFFKKWCSFKTVYLLECECESCRRPTAAPKRHLLRLVRLLPPFFQRAE